MIFRFLDCERACGWGAGAAGFMFALVMLTRGVTQLECYHRQGLIQ